MVAFAQVLFRNSLILQTKAGDQSFRLHYQWVSTEHLTKIRYTFCDTYFPKKCNKPRIVRHQVVGCKTLLRQLTGLLQTLHLQHQWPATDHIVTHNTFLKHILHGSHSLSLTFHQIWRDPLQHATASRWIIGCSSLIRQMKSCSLSFRLPYQRTFQDCFFRIGGHLLHVSQN